MNHNWLWGFCFVENLEIMCRPYKQDVGKGERNHNWLWGFCLVENLEIMQCTGIVTGWVSGKKDHNFLV